MKIKDLYDALRPFRTILKIFGLHSFNISKRNERMNYRRSYILLISIIFVQIVLIGIIQGFVIILCYFNVIQVSNLLGLNVIVFVNQNYDGWTPNRVHISLTSCNAILVGVIAVSNIYYEEYILMGLQYLFVVENKSNFIKYSRLSWGILSKEKIKIIILFV